MTTDALPGIAPAASRRTAATRPWYRQFWPWFLIALPASSVLLSVVTLIVAVRDADSLVRDDWYDAGMSINRSFDRERAAAAQQLVATLSFGEGRGLGVLLASPSAAMPAALRMELASPSDAGRDMAIDLVPDGTGLFRPAVPVEVPEGRWDVAIVPPDSSWRLAGRVTLERGRSRSLVAGNWK